jgi:hypothetical protein
MMTEDSTPERHYTCELDGRKIQYTNRSEFLVQIGNGPKGSYDTKYKFVGELSRALNWYSGVNVGRGYKKRLLMPSCAGNPVLAKQVSA